MSGFSAQWLALREPADCRARNGGVRAAALALFAGRGAASLVDLGCGSGSNLRALAEFLPARQTWRLVDHDKALLEAARAALTAWAESAHSDAGGALHLVKGGKSITAHFVCADLADALEGVLAGDIDLVTAAAFFDLVAAPWIKTFCAALAARQLPLYTVLTYDGIEQWSPPHPADAAMLAAFHAHQAGDKGFGPAAGPQALSILSQTFRDAGWMVTTGQSPWRLAAADAKLIAMLAEGSAGAVRETGKVAPGDIASWLAARRGAGAAVIGHEDFFARPTI